MAGEVWWNGQIVPGDQPVVSARDSAIQHGLGAYESCLIRSDGVFALRRHLDRLDRSLAGLGLPAVDHAYLDQGIAEFLAATKARAGSLRITVTGGVDGERAVLLTLARPRRAALPRLLTLPWPRERGPLAGLKVISNADSALAGSYLRAHDGDEGIWLTPDGQICEGTTSNVVLALDGELLTPPLSSGCLAGVTRELMLEWATAAGLPVRTAQIGELPASLLRTTPAIAICSTSRNVLPAAQIDGRYLTQSDLLVELVATFDRRASETLDP